MVFRWRGCLLKWVGVGWGSDTWKKQSMCVLLILKFVRSFVQANQSFLSLFRVSSKNRLIRLCNVSPSGPVGICAVTSHRG